VKSEPLRIGVIGCGNVLTAYRSPMEKLRARGLADVTVVCGRDSQRDSALAQSAAPTFTSRSEDVIRSNEVDLVLILTSMPEHARLAAGALSAGKHVLVEKPLATNLEDAAMLVDLAKRSPGLLLCAPFTLLSPTFQILSRRISRGDIGAPCLARARYGWSGPWWSDWFYKPGGGCLFDLGVYCITTLTGLLGPALRVTAMAGVAIPERQINGRTITVAAEDNAQVLIDFGNACFAVVTTGFTMQQYRCPAVEVYGTSGTIQMMGDDWDPDGYELWQNAIGAWQLFKETDPDWSWTDGLNHLVDCARNGNRPFVTPEHAFHVLEIMLKAQQSSREGRALQIDSTFTPPRFPEPMEIEPAHLMHDRTREHT
jgi:predicted dehydrogenase